MELYRALTYGSIALDSTSIPATTPYTSDPAWASTAGDDRLQHAATARVQRRASPRPDTDHHRYRIDTYIVDDHPATTYTEPVGRPTRLGAVSPKGHGGRQGRKQYEQGARAADVDVRLLDGAPVRDRLPDHLT